MDEQKQFVDNNSLETPETAQESTGVVSAPAQGSNSGVAAPPDSPQQPENPKKSGAGKLRALLHRINIYSLLLIFMVILILGFTYYSIRINRQSAADSALNTQDLTQEDLERLSGSDVSVGDPKQTLSIESNAIFAGKVLVRSDLDIAGALKVGGTLSLAGLTVGGTSALDQLQAKSLAIAGDGSVQGKLNVQNNLTVNGTGSFSGALSAPQLTVDTLQLNRDLQINRHIDAGGSTPGRTNGSALGAGGTASVSGSDTAGTVTINTGNAAPTGCFVTVTFAANFNATPHVVITPVGSAAAGLNFYVNRTTSNFSICTANDPPDNTASIIFDYIAVD